MFGDMIDLDRPVFAIVNEFDLGSHIERMRQGHPTWTQRQLECCLYWQTKARKQLTEEIGRFLREHPGCVVDTTPEAGGVNVTETLKVAGVRLEWPPRNIARQVALAGSPMAR